MAKKNWTRSVFRFSLTFSFLLSVTALETQSQGLNSLTQAQKDSGWVSLFDGKTIFGWHNQNKTVTAINWEVNDSAISRKGDGHIYSPVTAESFELSVDWKLGLEDGNSGIWLRIIETVSELDRTGPEAQIVGNTHNDYKTATTTVGSCYGMYGPDPAPEKWVKPAGQWNNFRIIMNGKHVEHWGNGVKIVNYEIDSPDWQLRKDTTTVGTKISKATRYGEVHYGNIVLTDHDSPVWYRNIRIRPLAGTQIRSAFPGFLVPTVSIAPHKGWRGLIMDKARMDAVFTSTGRSLPLLSLDGRSMRISPHGVSAGAYVVGDLNANHRKRGFQKIIVP